MGSFSERALFACVLFMPGLAHAAGVDDVRRELEQVSMSLAELEQRILIPELLESSHRLTTRLNDGQLLYLMKDYDRAAMLLLDVVDNPKNRAHPAYRDAVYYLAESLYELRNFRPAQSYFVEVSSIGNLDQKQQAVARLLEIALETRDAASAQLYLAKAGELALASPEPALFYAIAKYHYRTGDYAEALLLFDRVPEAHALGRQALYFGAVALVRLNKLSEAGERFGRSMGTEESIADSKDQTQAEIGALSRLALARLFYEQGRFKEAVEAYETLPKDSKSFDKAISESVWISIKEQNFEAAVRKLEILLIAQPSVLRGPDARLLQGRLLTMLGRHDESTLAFQEVLYEFGPIQGEMRTTVQAHPGGLDGHFNDVIGKNLSAFDLNTFLPAKAAEFAGTNAEADRALVLVSDLGQQGRDLKDARTTIERLDVALKAPNRLEIFPHLHDGALRAYEARARLTEARALLDNVAGAALGRDAEYAKVRAARLAAAARYGQAPHTVQAFKNRDKRVDTQIRDLDREAFVLSVEIRGLEAQLAAVSKFVSDVAEDKGGSGREPVVYAQVQRELDQARDLRIEYERLTQALELARITVGINDAASAEDEKLRITYAEALAAEERLLAARGQAIASPERQRISELDARAVDISNRVTGIADEKILDFGRLVEREKQNVASFGDELVGYQGETESMGGKIAARNFMAIYDRINAVVLEADVGIVDIAWKQKQDQTQLIAKTRSRQRDEVETIESKIKEATP